MLVILLLRRRRRRLSGGRSARQQEPSPNLIDPFTLQHVSISASKSQSKQALKFPLRISPGEAAFSGDNQKSEATVTSGFLSSDSTSKDVLHKPSSSAARSLTPSTTTALRQQRLHEQEQASASQLAWLEARIDSAEWVSRAEYNVMAVEISRLRAEVLWLRDTQQSDWALGHSNEMPPPYLYTRVECRCDVPVTGSPVRHTREACSRTNR
jgi:hypothetical protein